MTDTGSTRVWKKVSGDFDSAFFIFDEAGDTLEGKLINFREITTKHGQVEVADLEDKGNKWTVVISAGMHALGNLQVGNYVKITFLGLEKNPKTKRYFKKFEILVDASQANAVTDEDDPF